MQTIRHILLVEHERGANSVSHSCLSTQSDISSKGTAPQGQPIESVCWANLDYQSCNINSIILRLIWRLCGTAIMTAEVLLHGLVLSPSGLLR